MATEYHVIEAFDPKQADRSAVCFHAPKGVKVTKVDLDTILSWVYCHGLMIEPSTDAEGVVLHSSTMTAGQIVCRAENAIGKYFQALERLASTAA